MSVSSVNSVFGHASDAALESLFKSCGVAFPTFDPARPQLRRTALIKAVTSAVDDARNTLEALAHDIWSLADRGLDAEMALRAVCADQPALFEAVNEDRSLVDRIITLALQDSSRFRRAGNLVQGFRQRSGRYHRGYKAEAPAAVKVDLAAAIRAIQEIVQTRQGGKCVDTDRFDYFEPDVGSGVGPNFGEAQVHHIAVYLESAAVSGREFESGGLVSKVRLPAKEIAIDYNPRTGRLDIAGYGVGGGQVLERIAEAFGAYALAGAKLIPIKRREVHLETLKRRPRFADLPEPFVSARIRELSVRSKGAKPGFALFVGGEGRDAYDRMSELGASARLDGEFVRSVEFEFLGSATGDGAEAVVVRVKLTWPNSVSFEGARIEHRRAIERYLVDQGFIDRDEEAADERWS